MKMHSPHNKCNQCNIARALWIPLILGVKVLCIVFVTWTLVVYLIYSPLALKPVSSFSISQNPSKEYDEQPHSLRESTCIPKDNSVDSFESDHQQEERSDISSCPKIHHNSVTY